MMLAALVLAMASPSPCREAAELARAQHAWSAFVGGDFVRAPSVAEGHRADAIAALAKADADAAHCANGRDALPRASLHFEIDLVDARRGGGGGQSFGVLIADLKTLQRLHMASDQLAARQERVRELASERGVQLALPSPPSAPGPSCSQSDTPPAPRGTISPVVLDGSHLHHPHGSTSVEVQVSPGGNVLSTTLDASSGDSVLDQAVLDAVKLVTFSPATEGCRPALGVYRFTYTFPTY